MPQSLDSLMPSSDQCRERRDSSDLIVKAPIPGTKPRREPMTQLLEGKNAIVYGGGGGIGSGVARTFAREGATVFLAGRTKATLQKVAAEITSSGGKAHVAVLDALDEQAVDKHAKAVVDQAGSIDVSFNLITRGEVQGTPLVEMTKDDLLRAVVNGLQSNFITARAAGRR